MVVGPTSAHNANETEFRPNPEWLEPNTTLRQDHAKSTCHTPVCLPRALVCRVGLSGGRCPNPQCSGLQDLAAFATPQHAAVRTTER